MAKKYVSTKKYSYDEGSRKKKIILIVVAVLLALILAAVAAVFFLLRGGEETPGEPSFTIQSLPDKTTFYVGDAPVFSGLKVVLTTAEGNSVTLGPDNCKITGFNSTKAVKGQVITVQYKEYTDSFTIDILDPSEKPVEKYFTGEMSFKTKPKTQYKVGESLVPDGGVLIKEYDDGSKEEMAMTKDMIKGFVIDDNFVPASAATKAGKFTVKVCYLEDGKWGYAHYDITVTN